jgi:hypothetical protein
VYQCLIFEERPYVGNIEELGVHFLRPYRPKRSVKNNGVQNT